MQASSIEGMASPLFAAKVWHYWISIALFVPTILIAVAVIVGYLVKVVGPKYTRR